MPRMDHPASRDQREKILMGRALRTLRDRVRPKLTQDAAAEAADVTITAWQNYESGKRRFTSTLIDRVTKAIGVTAEELIAERNRQERLERIAASLEGETPLKRFEFPLHGRVRAGPQGVEVFENDGQEGTVDLEEIVGRGTRFLRVAGESMIPYAEPGGWVSYDTASFPRRGQGAVIVTTEGRVYIKRFERTVGGKLYVAELFPKERELVFDLAEIQGVYPVKLRSN